MAQEIKIQTASPTDDFDTVNKEYVNASSLTVGNNIMAIDNKVDLIFHNTERLNETLTEISRYWKIRNEIVVFSGWLSGSTLVTTTQIRSILQKKYFVSFNIQYLVWNDGSPFLGYANGDLPGTQYSELDASVTSGFFNDNFGVGYARFSRTDGGILIFPSTGAIITSIVAS